MIVDIFGRLVLEIGLPGKEDNMGKIIMIGSQKGGVGKTGYDF